MSDGRVGAGAAGGAVGGGNVDVGRSGEPSSLTTSEALAGGPTTAERLAGESGDGGVAARDRGDTSLYDRLSTAGHVALSGLGAVPVLGVVPDAIDLVWTAAEIPFGKSSTVDLTLAGAGILGTLVPGVGDGAAATAKIATRLGDDAAAVALRSGDDVAGGARNRAVHESFTDGLRAGMARPVVVDPKLDALIGSLYRPNARVGSGSTAAAVRQELATGKPVGGAWHSQKAEDGIRSIEKWIDRNPAASSGDRAAAENVVRDMQNALEGR